MISWLIAVQVVAVGCSFVQGGLPFREDCLCDPLNAFIDSIPLNRERTDELLATDGYGGRAHTVITEDGYMLKLYNIWKDQPPAVNSSREVVLFQHGILHSSSEWLVLGPGRSLAYQLVDLGYDVWIGNSRSTHNSHQHVKHCTCSREFWDFSWHEVGYYDLPAMIDTILAETQQPRLRMIGYSEGSAVTMVLLSMRPNYNDKLISLEALAPGIFLDETFYRFLIPFAEKLFKVFKSAYALYSVNKVTINACENNMEACSEFYYSFVGGETRRFNRSYVDRIYPNMPAGTSMREAVHYFQNIWTQRFAPYDFGPTRNLQMYGSASPPDYRLDLVTIPVNIHYGTADKIVGAARVERFASLLINSERVRLQSYPGLGHSDFMYGDAGFEEVYGQVIRWMLD